MRFMISDPVDPSFCFWVGLGWAGLVDGGDSDGFKMGVYIGLGWVGVYLGC